MAVLPSAPTFIAINLYALGQTFLERNKYHIFLMVKTTSGDVHNEIYLPQEVPRSK